MSVNNNPLRQYFRRPSVYLKLPSGGKYYPPNVINQTETGELAIYPMTAIDDITVRTPDALFNGSAIVELIKSCVPDILDPWAINSVDLDAILIAIKSATGQGDIDLESTCPECKEEYTYGINLMVLLSQLKDGDYNKKLMINDLSIKFKPLSYREVNKIALKQFEIQKMFSAIDIIQDEEEKSRQSKIAFKSIALFTMDLVAQCIDYIATPSSKVDEYEYILDFLENCDKASYEAIREYNTKLKEDAVIKPIPITCNHCSHKYTQPFTLNSSDFFG